MGEQVFKSGNCKSSSVCSQRLSVETFRLQAGLQRRGRGALGPRCLSQASQTWALPLREGGVVRVHGSPLWRWKIRVQGYWLPKPPCP